jgi:hypothetical protein
MSPPYLGGLRGSSSLLDHGHFGAVGSVNCEQILNCRSKIIRGFSTVNVN